LYVARRHQPRVRPTTISHGANADDSEVSRFRWEFDWVGTDDPTAMLCVPTALEVMAAMVDGGWPEIRRRNRELVLRGGRAVADALGVEDLPAPEAMVGSLLALPLPGPMQTPTSYLYSDPLHETLRRKYGIEVPIVPWGPRLVRISAQLYNALPQYEALGRALAAELSCEGASRS
jgi:isopenicillin-N epimerase